MHLGTSSRFLSVCIFFLVIGVRFRAAAQDASMPAQVFFNGFRNHQNVARSVPLVSLRALTRTLQCSSAPSLAHLGKLRYLIRASPELFNGKLDEFQVFNRTLEGSEIAFLAKK